MLGIFASNKAAHPLADEAERHRVLEKLVGAGSHSALKQVCNWLQGLRDDDSIAFPLRSLLIRQLDDAAQKHARTVGREYLTMAHLPVEDELRLWRSTRDFWAELGAAYSACLNAHLHDPNPPEVARVELARFVVRLMRAYAERLKWDQFRYWPSSAALWQIIGRAYQFAEQGSLARYFVSAYPGERQQTTVEQEYLRILVFQISSMDGLLPFEVEIADQLIGHFLPGFALADTAGDGYAYYIALDQRRAPSRMVGLAAADENTRYFSTAAALESLSALKVRLHEGEIAPELSMLRYRSPRVILPVLRHLACYWAPELPKRAHNRYRVRSRLAVLAGLEKVQPAVAASPDALAFPLADWTVEDVSVGGFRVSTGAHVNDLCPIGTLVGMRPEGGENWLVGVIRRFARTTEQSASIAVETISHHPIPVVFGAPEQRPGLLLDAPDEGEVVRIVMPGLGFEPDTPLTCSLLGRDLTLQPLELVERGAEFDLVRYRVVKGR